MLLNRVWQTKNIVTYLLMPLSWIFYCIAMLRKYYLRANARLSKPTIIVVGNISVGGNGKTPILIALANQLKQVGLTVGIISRGYGANASTYPVVCGMNSDPYLCGDEPVLIARQTQLEVVIDPNRVRAINKLSSIGNYDVILSDDGLQHYAMARHFEIAVVGSLRALGNGCLLPAGPLREPLKRLKTVDWVVGDISLPFVKYKTKVLQQGFFSVCTDQPCHISSFKGQEIAVFSGIALPERFHQLLHDMGLTFSTFVYPDHYFFKQEDFDSIEARVFLMTEKDAVKCRHLRLENAYYLKISVELDQIFVSEILNKLNSIH